MHFTAQSFHIESKMSTPETETESKYRAPALDKGLDIIELLAEQPGGLTRAEIVKAMGRRPSEIYRMLERLVARQYVARSLEGDRYALTLKLFLLSHAHPPLRRLTSQAQPLLDAFAQDAAQSIHLAVLEQGAAVVVAQASSPGDWEFRLKISASLGLSSTGSGKTLLAFQSDARRSELVATAHDAGHDSDLLAELNRIRTEGFRVSASGQLVGVTDISVPLLDRHSEAFGVLTCPYIAYENQPSDASDLPSIDETRARMQRMAAHFSDSAVQGTSL